MELSPDIDLRMAVGLIALAVATYAMIAARLSRWSVSAAFSFLVIGAVISGMFGSEVLKDLPAPDVLGVLAELTLALVLFSAASTIRLKRLEMDSGVVLRLLAIGLPLTIAAGTVVALGLFPGISLGLALLLAAILAPTDADLGQQVIADRSVPARIRRVLNVESGLNDGIAAPIVTVAIALAAFGDAEDMRPVVDAIWELGLALVVGVLIGGFGHRLLVRAEIRHTSTPNSRQLATLALALAAYFIASGLDSSGFIAAFAAGLAFGVGNREQTATAVAFTEAQSVLLSILVWLVFGLVVVGENVAGMTDPKVIFYALLSLTVLRMVPVAISLLGSGFDRVTVLFMGWFGPRGLASIVFVLLGLEVLEGAGVPSDPLGPVVAWTVIISVVVHGFSARPLASWYGRYATTLPPGRPEHLGEEEPPQAAWTMHSLRHPRS